MSQLKIYPESSDLELISDGSRHCPFRFEIPGLNLIFMVAESEIINPVAY